MQWSVYPSREYRSSTVSEEDIMKRIRGIRKLAMHPVVWLAALLTLGFMVTSGPVYAGTCAATATCTFDLTVANVTQLSPIDIRVTWTNNGTNTVFSVQWISGGPGTPRFINEFGFNAGTTTVAVSGTGVTPANWSVSTDSQIDGFGKFATDVMANVGGSETFGITSPVIFTLGTLITSIPVTSANTEFVAHVGGYSSGCSAFVGEGGSTVTPTSNPSCATTTGVPEPSSSLLLGLSLVGIALASLWGTKLMRSNA